MMPAALRMHLLKIKLLDLLLYLHHHHRLFFLPLDFHSVHYSFLPFSSMLGCIEQQVAWVALLSHL
jgi:hypothetical protein